MLAGTDDAGAWLEGLGLPWVRIDHDGRLTERLELQRVA